MLAKTHPQCLALARSEMRLRLHLCWGGADLSWRSKGFAFVWAYNQNPLPFWNGAEALGVAGSGRVPVRGVWGRCGCGLCRRGAAARIGHGELCSRPCFGGAPGSTRRVPCCCWAACLWGDLAPWLRRAGASALCGLGAVPLQLPSSSPALLTRVLVKNKLLRL